MAVETVDYLCKDKDSGIADTLDVHHKEKEKLRMTQRSSTQTTERIEMTLTEKAAHRAGFERNMEGLVYFSLRFFQVQAEMSRGQVDKSQVLKAGDINLDVIIIKMALKF